MKVLSLKVENYKRVEAVLIEPKGNTVTITGKNDQGKSSTLDALDAALGGAKVEMPIRKGQLKSTIRVELGNDKVEAIVERTYTLRDDKPVLATLKVSTPEGALWPKPTEFLAKVMGSVSLDPVKFIEMKPEDQYKAVRAFVPGFDFVQNDADYKTKYAERTQINRELEDASNRLNLIEQYGDDWPTEEIDVSALAKELQDATEHNGKIAEEKREIERLEDRQRYARKEVEDFGEEIAELERQIKGLVVKQGEAQTRVEGFKDDLEMLRPRIGTPIEIGDLVAKMDGAKDTNQKVQLRKSAESRTARLAAEVEEKREASQAYTKALDANREAARKAISEAKMPVPGLSFGDGMVLLNEVPFSQASYAQKLRTAVAISAAHAPELRLIKIEDGDKLDDDSWASMTEFAEQHDMQIWRETVQHGEPVGFVIVDGKNAE